MALKNNWNDRVDGIDDVLSEDINQIAHGVIEIEEAVGDTENALDAIIEIQESLIDGFVEDERFKPVSIDLSNFDTNGQIVETDANGNTKTTIVEFDADENPVKITENDGNEITLIW